MIEENFRRAMTVTNGDFSSFLSRPIAAIFVFASLAIVGFFVIRYVMRRLMPGQIQQAN